MKQPLCLMLLALLASCATAARMPGTSLADAQLQHDTWNFMRMISGCPEGKVINTELTRPTVAVGPVAIGQWTERWTIDCFGTTRVYNVNYTSSHPTPGTWFQISPEKPASR
jgi:hypothetical protein